MDSASLDLNPKSPTFTLNNFQVALLSNDSSLTIKAENKTTLKHYDITITNDQVRDMTCYIFPDLEILYVGLLDAFEQKDPAVTISLSEHAALTYTWERVYRGKTRTENFTVFLTEEVEDENKRLTRQVERLLKKVAEQEQRIQALEKENNRLKSDSERAMADRLESIENELVPKIKEDSEKYIVLTERIDKGEKQSKEEIAKVKEYMQKTLATFERMIMLKIEGKDHGQQKAIAPQAKQIASVRNDIEFNPNCSCAQFFSFSSGNKTLTANQDKVWKAMFSKSPLAKPQKVKFSVRVDVTKFGNIMIGLCPSYLMDKDCVYNFPDVYCYNAFGNGSIFTNGKRLLYLSNVLSLKAGSVLDVHVDLEGKKLIFEIGGFVVSTVDILNNEYYVFAELYEKGDQITLV